jgi:outer membrane protein OmpA-like peptidoglycan-associated protein
MKRIAVLLLGLLCLSLPAAAEQKDDPKCKDHPLFTRMPDSWIRGCSEKEFDAHAFPLGKGKTERVEGRLWTLTYYPQNDAKSKPSELQILRNFENAVKKLGGTVLYAEKSKQTLKLTKDGKEFWVDLWAEFTGKYGLTIVEKAAMAQDIVANAEVFSNDIRTTGHAAIYGILFDTGKADIKPESAQAIGEVAKLLKADAALKIFVVGHTDGVGSVDANLKLSQARAEAVVQSLVREHGIAAARLTSFGNGPFAPVASNDAEEGRAKNRRVELVKQ